MKEKYTPLYETPQKKTKKSLRSLVVNGDYQRRKIITRKEKKRKERKKERKKN